MNFKLRNLVAATLAGSFLMGFGANAMADSTTDIVNALVAKGVLTEEEGALLTKGRTDEAAGQAKALKKAGKVTVSDAIDNATIYGDIRVRHESRNGTGTVTGTDNVKEKAEKDRYKVTLGVKTESGDWFSDFALSMGASGRSDNADFGKGSAAYTASGMAAKDTVYVKRASIGYKATDWLTLQAGRMENPLYTTSMVWDADLVVQGFAEKAKFKLGNADVFLTAMQSSVVGPHVNYDSISTGSSSTNISTNTTQNALFAFQAGAQLPINDQTSAKAALTYTTYAHDRAWGAFRPLTSGSSYAIIAPTSANNGGNSYGTNDLNLIEIPGEINFMASPNVGVRLFGDYALNLSGSDRFNSAVNSAAISGAVVSPTSAQIQAAGNDDTAWLVGFAVGSAKDLKAFEGNKMAKGDWNAKIWYQEVGTYAIDQNLTDTDVFDARVNTKGTAFKAQYNVKDNVAVNFTAAHASRKNSALGMSTSYGNDMGINLNSFNLLQADLTYKF